MKAILTSAVLLVFALSTAVSAGEQAEKKVVKKTVKTEQKGAGAWLGVALGDISTKTDEEGAQSSSTKGAIIQEVMNDSPADSAGLKEEDVIVEINGKAVTQSGDVVKRIGGMKPGEKATIVVMRGDAKKTFTVALGSQPAMRRHIEMRMPRMGMGMQGQGHPFGPMMMEHRAGVEGMKLMELTDQLGRYFEAPDGKALLVTEVKKNSNARKAGIEAGDVITKVGSTDIEDMSDLHQALRDAKEGSTVDVDLIRKGAHKNVKLQISERKDEMMNFGNGFPRHQDFRFENFDFDPEQIHEMMRDLQPQLDRIKKEIRIRMHGSEVNHLPAPPEAPEEPDTDL